ncbi:MAG TPA: cellulase family glycosylhydrolase [Solirubrobacteraceae bacterium]|jgi:hypothetical protein|nr:cellulase family glycosylhydrolase [Solirubrobacteraceae bacterium]
MQRAASKRLPPRYLAAIALLLCVLCATTTSLAAGSTRARTSATPLLGGVNIQGLGAGSTPVDADFEVAQAKALHAKLIRAELPWSVLEPRGAGKLDPRALAYTDRLMNDAAAAGIGVIVLADSSPCWASAAPASIRAKCVPGRGSRAYGYPPAHAADFAAFARTLVERYPTQLTAFEVWNEPDQANERYFAGPHKPQRYAALLAAADTAVKQANPKVTVLAGSLVGSNGVFLKLLYKAGIKGHYDGLAVHFYTLSLAALRATHAVQLANGDSTPLWFDEFGWSDCYPRHKIQEEQGCVTAAVQAQNITNMYRALSSTSYVAAAALYELQDGGGDSFGVITSHNGHKPSFTAMSNVLASPFGAVSPVTLSLRKSGGRVLAAGSGPVGDYMRLEAFQGSVLRYRAALSLDRFNRFKLALPKVLGTHNLRVRVYQQWTGPSKAAQRSI